jgi:hypothetical protein
MNGSDARTTSAWKDMSARHGYKPSALSQAEEELSSFRSLKALRLTMSASPPMIGMLILMASLFMYRETRELSVLIFQPPTVEMISVSNGLSRLRSNPSMIVAQFLYVPIMEDKLECMRLRASGRSSTPNHR